MKKSMIIGVSAIVAVAAIVLMVQLLDAFDPCRDGRREHAHVWLRKDNPYFVSCRGHIYFVDAEPKTFRPAEVDTGSFRPLPFRFGVDKKRFYYIERKPDFYGKNSLRVVPDVDLASVEVLGEREIRDRYKIYSILEGQVITENLPR